MIAFFVAEYRERYQSIWPEFLKLAAVEEMDDARIPGELLYSYSGESKAAPSHGGETRVRPHRVESRAANGVVEYTASRLTFKRDVIEPLGASGVFRVVTPVGTFEMSKEEFCRAFPNVRVSCSYRDAGYYNYPTPPRLAAKYRVG